MHDQPGLFDLDVPKVPAPARSGRGRARETYARTVVADVTVLDRRVLQAASLRLLDQAIVIGEAPDDEDDLMDPREEVVTSDTAAVQWCLEPTAGMWPLLDSGAVLIQSIGMGCDDDDAAPVRAWWTVTVKIRDAGAARELALASCPAIDAEARAEVESSFAAVWQWAVPPYGPMDGIPGISWAPVEVGVEQVLSRPR